jgi:hypothetical protein
VRRGGLGAQGRASGLEHDDRLLLRHALGHFGKRAAVLQVLAVLRDDVRVVVLLEERQQIVLVDVGLVPRPTMAETPIFAERRSR